LTTSLSQPDLSIIVVNKDTKELLRDCLHSIFQHRGNLELEIWVVDNASVDGSPQMVLECFPNVSLIRNSTNPGFAKANNQALRKASGRHYLLLNSDTLVLPCSLQALVRKLDAESTLAAIGPQLLNLDGSVQPSCGAYPNLFTQFLYESFLFKLVPSPFPYGRQIHFLQRGLFQKTRSVDWVTGAALAMRGSAVKEIGELDENLFMYGEDLDWCWRARQADFGILYYPRSQIIHLGGASRKGEYARWIQNYTRAALEFFRCHHSKSKLLFVSLLIIMGSLMRLTIWKLIGAVFPTKRNESQQRCLGYILAVKLVLRQVGLDG
jgi:GT2 family glycosyltransferase